MAAFVQVGSDLLDMAGEDLTCRHFLGGHCSGETTLVLRSCKRCSGVVDSHDNVINDGHWRKESALVTIPETVVTLYA